jgi:hypothetical protein
MIEINREININQDKDRINLCKKEIFKHKM